MTVIATLDDFPPHPKEGQMVYIKTIKKAYVHLYKTWEEILVTDDINLKMAKIRVKLKNL